MGGNKTERKPHHCCLLHATCEGGKAAAGSYSQSQLKESKLHNGRKNTLTEKGFSEKIWDQWGDLKTTDKLTIISLEWRCWGVEELQGCGRAVAANTVAHWGVTI